MAHGTKDWGPSAAKSTVFPLLDMGELAARLGSPVTFDRRGDVIWMDDFEHTINRWWPQYAGTGAVIVLSDYQPHRGTHSAKLTAGSTSLRLAGLQKTLHFPVLSKLGFEISFHHSTRVELFVFQMYLRDGALGHTARVGIDIPSGNLKIYIPPDDWLSIGKIGAPSKSFSAYETIKMVIDPISKKYTRILIQGQEIDVSAHTYVTVGTTAAPIFSVYPWIISEATRNGIAYFDNAIVTQNED